MATAVKSDKAVKDPLFSWEGKDRSGKLIRGEMRAGGKASVNATLRRQGITVVNVKEQKFSSGKKIKEKDIAIFTRQLATMMKAGVPLLQAFDISAKGNANRF
jgi:type IV pilus assembly protein PilC